MSILHDSLQRFERAGAAPSAPWSLANSSGKGHGKELLSRKSWTLLLALAVLSLAAWGAVSLWSVPSFRVGGIVAEIPHARTASPAALHHPATGAATGAATGSATATQSQAPSASGVQQRYVPLENIASRPGAVPRESLDQNMLAELNTQLSSLLAIIAGSGKEAQSGQEPPLEQVARHGEHDGNNEWATRSDAAAGEVLTPEPVVHVSVQARPGQADLGEIRLVEERLGQALREQHWDEFDREFPRLSSLKPHARNSLAQWQAARAMAMADYPEAQRILEGLRHVNPRDLQTGLNLALVYEAQGRIESARDVAASLVQDHPLDPRVQTMLDRLENRTRR